MARSASPPPAIGVADSLPPLALDAMRAAERREATTVTTSRPRGRAWFVLWFFGAAVFSFSTMAALERHGLSQLLMPAAPPPAEVSVEAPVAVAAARPPRAFDDVLASPWRRREPGETVNATSVTAATVATTASKKTETVSAPPAPAPKREAASKGLRASAPAAAPPPPAKPSSSSGSDEVAAAAAMLEKAKGEQALE